MNYTLEEKYDLIKKELLKQKSNNPIKIVKDIMNKEFVNIHGPEHHFLDGGAFLVAYSNVTNIDLENALEEHLKRTKRMPGAMCGMWGVCGASTSIGAALSIINKTSPLSDDEYYKDNMEYTSEVIKAMSKIGGPRCCKRNAFLSLGIAVKFVNRKYNLNMEMEDISCGFSDINMECLKNNCLFYKGE